MADRRSGAHSAGSGPPPGRLGRDLLIPYILLILSTCQAHGYLLLRQLSELGLNLVDPTTVYRTLRGMERDGLISSTWDTRSDGPARRVYAVTEAGAVMLSEWVSALDAYQRTLTSFFDLYAGMGQAAMDAFAGAMAAKAQGQKEN